MKVKFQAVDFNADQKLINFVEEKVNKLEQFYDKIIHADVHLKLVNTSAKENKTTEILLSVPGQDVIAKKTAKTFEEGVDECVTSLERQLKKRKGKQAVYA